jgi:serine/threonine-protein kinase
VLARLAEIAAADESFVEQDVLDRWVPQISSKKPDTPLPDGSVWSAMSILEDHRTWREQFPRVHLLWSGDYSTFDLTDYWVTIVAVPFDTPEGALGWCNDHALPDDDCYAKLISHTHPHEGSTRLR